MPVLEELLPKAIAAVSPRRATNADLWADTLGPYMWAVNITTPFRIAAFVGQVAVESDAFTKLSEDLWYSEGRLCDVWPDHFWPMSPMTRVCAGNPEALANVVYANRMGNGDIASGDGWRYRGAGLIQLTGKDNHAAFAKAAGLDLGAGVGDYLRTATGAAHSACWYWTERELNPLADCWLLTRLSVAINGSTEGLPQRLEACNTARKAMGV